MGSLQVHTIKKTCDYAILWEICYVIYPNTLKNQQAPNCSDVECKKSLLSLVIK